MSMSFQFLTLISQLITKRTDAFLALFVVSIVFMMILPLPIWLVDSLIALNITFSALLIVLALYMPGPLAFSTFPAFLLITTLFRLSLSITTTRLILLEGDAGKIVETFGNFVVGGNLVVGLVIFIIITIVNFLVITKGSERVAEVSARFSLDAMPGKQMSIDSDLRGGVIDATEAQEKRKLLAKESQLFGALDGSMKFVKGDAIAGIIIVLVNIIGGFSIGILQQGMSSGEAMTLYSILTIGDGLVAQIPALLISLSAGMIITRVKDDALDKKNIGQELSNQLSSEPKAWIISAVVLFGFAIIPGMPTAAFIFFSIFILSVGVIKIYLTNSKKTILQKMKEEEGYFKKGKGDVKSFDTFEQITIVTHTKHEETPFFDELLEAIRKQRNDIISNHGFILPGIVYNFNEDIEEDSLILRFYEIPEVVTIINEDLLAVSSDNKHQLDDLSILYSDKSNVTLDNDYLWVDIKDKSLLEDNNITSKTIFDVLQEKSKKAFLKNGYQFFGIDYAKQVIAWVSTSSPELMKELERLMPASKLAELLKNLLKESVSLKSLKKIIEVIVENVESEREVGVLTEIVRMALKEQICSQIAVGKDLDVCLLEPDFEDYLRQSLRKTPTGGFFSISQQETDIIISKVFNATQNLLKENKPVAMVVAQDIRPYFRELIRKDIFELPVLSFSELSDRLYIKPIARLAM